MNKLFIGAGALALLAASGAAYWYNQPAKVAIEQEYILSPETEGMDCKGFEGMTVCRNEFGGRLDGLEYQTLMFASQANGQAISIVGNFKRSQYQDGVADFVARYGEPSSRLGDPGDQRAMWKLANGVVVMRERAARIGEGTEFSLFCFGGSSSSVPKELLVDCEKMFTPAAI